MAEEIRKTLTSDSIKGGPFLAKIVSHLDPTYMGTLEVQLLHEVGNDDSKEGQLHQVRYMSPFYGVTSVDFNGAEPDNYNNTQKSYGMWMIPPDVGTVVVVIFIEGDPKKGYWIGCVQDESMNFMVPGYAATKFAVTDSKATKKERVPVAEYNKRIKETVQDPTKYPKPAHPFEKILEAQGLLEDDIRGITTSSARREVPSAVFGISTPGPVDKQSGARQGKVGKSEHKITGAFVSRLGGSSFVMDDGDDKFLRKKKASEGPPEYVSVEQNEKGGDPTIPHNELIRLRTRTGHQILMHNSEDLIYIGNARGTTWIELTSNGKIDIFATDSISIHTKNDLNVTADRDINFTAKNNINMYAGVNINQQAGSDWNVKVGANGKITTGATLDVKSGGASKWSAASVDIKTSGAIKNQAGGVFSAKASSIDLDGGPVNLNGGAAGGAADAAEAPNAPKAYRIPQVEPWKDHENWNPLEQVPEKTKAIAEEEKSKTEGSGSSSSGSSSSGSSSSGSSSKKFTPKYTTKTDTFEKLKPPKKDPEQGET